MHLTLKPSYTLKNFAACCFSILLIASSAANSTASAETETEIDSNPVVVTIKPLYSLVAHLTDGIETPVLLMKQAQSPHHYNMRPSERRLLANARMIVWIGPQMESYLDKVMQQQAAVKVQAIQAEGIHLLSSRATYKHQHQHQHPGHTNIDPHIWLSPENAIAVSRHITEQLILNNSAHTEKYKDNLQQLIVKISQASEQAMAELKDSKQPFIAYHDAFQYFENEYSLNYVDSISTGEETSISLKQLLRIKDQIKNNNIQCIVFQEPKPDIINTLTRQTRIKTAALDPLGLNIEDDKDAWFKIIEHTVLNFKHCLTP